MLTILIITTRILRINITCFILRIHISAYDPYTLRNIVNMRCYTLYSRRQSNAYDKALDTYIVLIDYLA